MGREADLLHTTGGFSKITTLPSRGVPRPWDDPSQYLEFSDPVSMVCGDTRKSGR